MNQGALLPMACSGDAAGVECGRGKIAENDGGGAPEGDEDSATVVATTTFGIDDGEKPFRLGESAEFMRVSRNQVYRPSSGHVQSGTAIRMKVPGAT